jgi:hypothetical protein
MVGPTPVLLAARKLRNGKPYDYLKSDGEEVFTQLAVCWSSATGVVCMVSTAVRDATAVLRSSTSVATGRPAEFTPLSAHGIPRQRPHDCRHLATPVARSMHSHSCLDTRYCIGAAMRRWRRIERPSGIKLMVVLSGALRSWSHQNSSRRSLELFPPFAGIQ